ATQRAAISLLDREGAAADIRRGLYFLTTALLILLALHFRRCVGYLLVALGIALNFVPMASHGGLMPVDYEIVRASGLLPEVSEADIGKQVPNSKDVILRAEDISFPWLSDRFVVTVPLYGTNVYSLGDFIAFAGAAAAALQVVVWVFLPAGVRRRNLEQPA
ncbi:MAG: DUF5317 family protein, partial [Dehalococcoidia bacterium]|nr:DUF5317 family protein [Dehalococcoidia bacterium]